MGVSAMATSPHSITLNWSPPPPSEQNGPIIGYIINVTVLESDETFQRETDTTSLTVDARPYRTYSFFVSAKTVVGYGPFGTDVIIRTPESGEYPPTISHAPWARGCIYKIVLLPVFRVLAHDQSPPPPLCFCCCWLFDC